MTDFLALLPLIYRTVYKGGSLVNALWYFYIKSNKRVGKEAGTTIIMKKLL